MGFWGIFFLILFLLTLVIMIVVLRRNRIDLNALVKENFALHQSQKKGEQALSETQRWVDVLRTVSDSASDRLILVDQTSHVLYINQAARELFAQDRQKLIASNTLIATTHRHELEDVVQKTFTDKEPILSQIALDGRTYSIICEYMLLGSEPVVLLMFQDVSEIQRLGRARREMVANISHELRTPLTSIRLLIDTIKRTPVLEPDLGRLVERIAAETDTLQQLAEELLDLSMIEAGRAEFIFTTGPIKPLVEKIADHLREQAERKNVHLINLIPDELEALFDPSQIERVVKNLTHNAIKFSPEGGSIRFEAALVGEALVSVSITDEGVGIIDSEKERVFERFYRGDRSRNTPGTGLGLSIAKHIIQAHGGSIWVEDGPHLQGSRFIFTLQSAS